MTEALYLDEMFMNEFNAKVLSVSKGRYVVLDRIAFYPKSGGVATDLGKLTRNSDGKEFDVVFVGKFDGDISHEINEEGLEPGEGVRGTIDWNRRHFLMRYHTAAHILSGVFWNEGEVKIGGNELDVSGGRMDFTLENFDRETIESYVEEANRVVERDLPIEIYYISREELESDPDLTKLAVGFPSQIKRVRIVDIKGLDRQPDGGCHVSSTREVGTISFIKMKNKGKNNRRMYFSLVE
jgi:misacylated tRNA(Ala) deacylase